MSVIRRAGIRESAAIIALVIVLVVSSAWYLASQRPAGDRNLARGAVEGLTFIAAQYANTDAPHEMYASGLRVHHEAVDLYLSSDSASRLPEVTSHVARAWDAYLLADELWRLHEDGQDRPGVVEVVGAAEFAEGSPELAPLITDDGSGPVLDNSDMTVVRLLLEIGAQERGEASSALGREVNRER